MRKLTLTLAVTAALAVPAATSQAQQVVRVNDPTPNKAFTDSHGNEGFVEVRQDGVRACNENPGTPAGDALTGYVWIDIGGNGNAGEQDDDGDPDGITYGNGHVGAGDYDGEGTEDGNAANGTEEKDCPGGAAP